MTEPKQARSEATLLRLLDSAEALISEHGTDDISLSAIARRAGVSVGAIYARFENKEALLRAVVERRLEMVDAIIEPALDDHAVQRLGFHEMIHMLLYTVPKYADSNRSIALAFIKAAANNPRLWDSVRDFRERSFDRLTETLLATDPGIEHPDPRAALRFALETTSAVFEYHLFHRFRADGSELCLDEVSRELEILFFRYLGLPIDASATHVP
ncbi:MAG: TetR/AcrR family transcriptional regulator [bacterium]|nr:TetR/AcrR family transcriptional regulator [bacterium]